MRMNNLTSAVFFNLNQCNNFRSLMWSRSWIHWIWRRKVLNLNIIKDLDLLIHSCSSVSGQQHYAAKHASTLPPVRIMRHDIYSIQMSLETLINGFDITIQSFRLQITSSWSWTKSQWVAFWLKHQPWTIDIDDSTCTINRNLANAKCLRDHWNHKCKNREVPYLVCFPWSR